MRNKLFKYFGLLLLLTTNIIAPLNTAAEAVVNSNYYQQENKKSDNSEKIYQEGVSSTSMSSENNIFNSTTADNRSDTSLGYDPENANPRGPTVKAVASDVITNMYITDYNGNPLNNSLGSWDSFRIYGDFSVPNNQVHAGDTTTITLPEGITFYTTENFEIKDDAGNVVANAVIDPNSKTIVLTYTNFVENNSDVSGSFYFYARVDTTVVKEKTTVNVDIDIDGKSVNAGKVEYDGPGEKNDDPILKYGWIEDGSPRTIGYYLAINYSKKKFENATVTDRIKYEGGQIDKSSFTIYKGSWEWDEGSSDWILGSKVNVTNDYTTNFDPDGKGFSVDLGDISESDGFEIQYKINLNYDPIDGEKFDNHAILSSDKEVIKEVESQVKYQKGGGEAEGYKYKISIHKKDEDGNNLPGAEFEVVRDKTGQVLGKIISDATGYAEINELLKDDYTIKEIKAPTGYQLSNKIIKISADDFNSNKEFSIDVLNKKVENTGIKLQAKKVLTGKTLNAGDFEFVLKDSEGKTIQTKSNDTSGVINFDEIAYDNAGTYNYTISEVAGSQAGMTYDKHEINVEVTVKDIDGKLVATAVYTGDQTFNNSYKAATGINNINNGVSDNKNISLFQKKLPATGDEKSLALIICGMFIILSMVLYIANKKKNK